MLIQVTTKHGKKFRRAGMVFGPRPKRLWLGDKPPDSSLKRIDQHQLTQLERATGENGPLFIERDVPNIAVDDTETLVEELRAQVKHLQKARDKATRRATKAENKLVKKQEALQALEEQLAESRDARETLEGTVASYEATLAEIRGE